ncbi:recombinase family protein [Salmonella enterica]|uniref:recombinase family protein n=1 Tax=Citrobacter portucalensis TaxID=1639133 RepID=UPI00127E32D0|nr:recombinase family protein [Citrobacter portucalensis]EBP9465272.1 recombinase family protein [Salmonella enterica]ECT8279523.1 recombinase family protein [Salmonella enterica subsp. enterica]EDV7219573.1 recombinase family protein [Salmonella enterica subsp. enterica serovar Saintpaul]HCZ4652272.1 recombinase family protein [Salmonella enterica subsp. enterica serovar Saintpaul str. CFSAN004157]HCZ4695381.1 recombinase family protein [Salmonella enterica subsp. enterica serovar Saintpaul s
MQYGYARVSTFDQNLEMQLEALNRLECDQIFEDKISGAKSKRPGLNMMMKKLRPGDTVVVWKLDRLGRSLIHLVDLLRYFRSNNIEFISITEGIRISTSIGRFAYTMLSAAAEMERENIIERTRAGLAVARAKGRIGGRRPKLTNEQWAQAGRLIAAGETRQRVAIIFDVGVSTLYKKFPASVIHDIG